MKIILAPIFVIGILQSVFAQVEKGNYLIGGSLGFNNSTQSTKSTSSLSSTDLKSVSFSISPNVSFFVVNKFSAGLMPSYSYSDNNYSTSSYENKTHTFGIGPVIRYYFPFGQWAIFPEVSYNFGWATSETTSGFFGDSKIKYKPNSLKAGVGITYFINNKVGVEGILFYKQTNTKYDNSSIQEYNTSSINFNIGLQVYLSRSKE